MLPSVYEIKNLNGTPLCRLEGGIEVASILQKV